MTRFMDQDPPHSYQPVDSDPTNRANYPPTFDPNNVQLEPQSRQEYHQPQYALVAPETRPLQPEQGKNGNSKRNRIIATVAGVGLIGAGLVGISFNKDGEKAPRANGGDRETSAPVNPGSEFSDTGSRLSPAEADAGIFVNTNEYSRVEQMDYAGTTLNQSVEADTQLVLDELKRSGWDDYDYFNRPIAEPSINNTPQEIWDQITLGYAHVRALASSGEIEDINEAKKIATAVAEEKEYSDLVETLATGGDNFSEVGLAYSSGALPVKASGSYSGVEANGAPIISFTKEALTKNSVDRVQVIARLTQGTDESSARWVVVKTLPAQ